MTKAGGQQAQGSSAGWLPELDGLRCLAALAVALVHYTPATAPEHALPVILRKYGDQFSIANIGVAFFYGLSAFLLTYIELKQRQAGRIMNVRRFYLRRTLRIWPLYFFIIAVCFWITTPGVFSPYASEDIRLARQWGLEHLWMYLTFTSNWSLAIDGIGWYAHRALASLSILWSIAVEEQFYLLFPALLLLCFRRHGFWKKLVVAAMLLGFASRIALIWAGVSFSGGKPAGYIYYSTLSYLEVFAAGSLAAAIVTDARMLEKVRVLFTRRFFSLALTASFIALGWLWRMFLFPPYSRSSSVLFRIVDYAITVTIYPFVGIFIGAILIWININGMSIVARFLRTRLMRSLGTLSFGIYMWHPLVQPVTRALDARYVSAMQPELRMIGVNLLFVLYLSLTVACAGLSYFLVEAPVLRWKERLAGHAGSKELDRVRDDGRNPTFLFPGAVAIAVLSAILVSAQASKPADPSAPILSDAGWAHTSAQAQVLSTPTGLTAFRQSPTNEILLAWNAVPGIEHYELEIVEMRSDLLTLTRIIGAPAANTTYGVSNISSDSTYGIRIRSCGESACSEWSMPAIITASPQRNQH